MIKTVWECSAETEAQRILYASRQIAHGFYQQHNFFVLPKLTGAAKYATVVFPNLHYCSVHNFWCRVKNIDIDHLPLAVEPKLFEQTQALLNFKQPDFLAIQAQWQKAETEILRAINRLIPSPDGLVRSLTIWPTNYGTTCSFNLADKYPADIIIFLRSDCGVKQITESILTSLIRKKTERDLGAGWNETELITDWLTKESFLAKILMKYGGRFDPTLKLTRNQQNGRTYRRSQTYLAELGLAGKKALPENPKNLTAKENKAFNCLKRRQGQAAGFEELGEIICPQNYSLFCVAKTIERLRRKLEENGVSGTVIQTVRGKGYLLK